MKKNILLRSIFMLSLIAVCSSCIFYLDGTAGKGQIIEELITVREFNSIVASSSADVTVTKGEALQVSLADYENLIEYWDVKVVDNTLFIQPKAFSSIINSKAKVTVVMPTDLKEVKVSGSGSIKLNDAFPELEKASISGSGNIKGNVNTNYGNLMLIISGSGSFDLIGSADELKAVTSGSGRMNLFELTAKSVTCTISGSGNMYVNAVDYLNAVITGSGSIFYAGNPVVEVQASGSGRLRHQN
jgi:hypothetical protein